MGKISVFYQVISPGIHQLQIINLKHGFAAAVINGEIYRPFLIEPPLADCQIFIFNLMPFPVRAAGINLDSVPPAIKRMQHGFFTNGKCKTAAWMISPCFKA